jgi:hypothetical protein
MEVLVLLESPAAGGCQKQKQEKKRGCHTHKGSEIIKYLMVPNETAKENFLTRKGFAKVSYHRISDAYCTHSWAGKIRP